MTVLDVSNYDWPTFDADCLKSHGVTGVIIGCQQPDLARGMAYRSRKAGLPILGFYQFLYFGEGADQAVFRTTQAIAWAVQFDVRRVWLDAELDAGTGTVTPAVRRAELWAAVKAVEDAGLEAGIYTGGWWWPENMQTSEFSMYPLWHAEYPADGHAVSTVNYGGWTKVSIHQYTSTFHVCGRDRDANYVFETQQEDAMTDNDILAVFGSNETFADGTPDPGTRLANAKFRYQQAIETGHSPFDVASQAIADAKEADALMDEHLAAHPSGPSGGLKRGDKVTLT